MLFIGCGPDGFSETYAAQAAAFLSACSSVSVSKTFHRRSLG